jgi:hypothetical protein
MAPQTTNLGVRSSNFFGRAIQNKTASSYIIEIEASLAAAAALSLRDLFQFICRPTVVRPAQLSLFSSINPIVTDCPHGASGEKAANH